MTRWGALVRLIVAVHWMAIAALVFSLAALLLHVAGVNAPGHWAMIAAVAVGGPAILSDWILGRCFLTLWENRARRRAGWAAYDCSFFAHYAPIIPDPVVDGVIRMLRLSAVAVVAIGIILLLR